VSAEAVGRFLRDLPPLHGTEKPVSFDPVQATFLQKLVREATLQEGVTVKKEEFFAAIACLDYFTEVIAARNTVLGDIAVVVEELDKMADYLDPDLELLTRYLGVYIEKDLKGEQLFKPGSLQAIERRHERGNARAAAASGELDLYHLAVGRFVCDQARHPEVKQVLGRLDGRNDLRAALLCDAVLTALPETPAPAALSEGKALPALTELLRALTREAPHWSLREHVERLKARL
jgi:hypothetical protein